MIQNVAVGRVGRGKKGGEWRGREEKWREGAEKGKGKEDERRRKRKGGKEGGRGKRKR